MVDEFIDQRLPQRDRDDSQRIINDLYILAASGLSVLAGESSCRFNSVYQPNDGDDGVIIDIQEVHDFHGLEKEHWKVLALDGFYFAYLEEILTTFWDSSVSRRRNLLRILRKTEKLFTFVSSSSHSCVLCLYDGFLAFVLYAAMR